MFCVYLLEDGNYYVAFEHRDGFHGKPAFPKRLSRAAAHREAAYRNKKMQQDRPGTLRYYGIIER